MHFVDEIEVAWVSQFHRLTRFVASASAFLFVAYGLVDWLAQPGALDHTWQWRVIGATPCLLAVLIVGNPRWSRWLPAYIAFSGSAVTAVASVIYVGVMHHVILAVAVQMQVLMALAVVAALRSAVRTTLLTMLLSMNLAFLHQGSPWQQVALANWMLGCAAVLLLIVSERTYRTFSYRRDLEARLLREATIVQSSGDAIIGMAPDGTVSSWNAGAQALLGYSSADMLGRDIGVLLSATDPDPQRQAIDRIARGGSGGHLDAVLVRRGGAPVHVSVAISPLHDTGGALAGASLIARDITQRRQTERALLDQESQFHVAIETSTDGFWAADAQGRLLEVNQAYAAMSGYRRQELLAMGVADLDANHSADEVTRRMELVRNAGSLRFETAHRRKDGGIWPVEVVASYSPLGGGRYFVFVKDLTEQKRAQDLIWHQANFDRLTDLPNRALLYEHLSHACSMARRSGRRVALLFADLDGFKQVNDLHGHEAGDIVLVTVARRWLAAVRDTDTVARLGGDEFAIVLGDVTDADTATGVAQKLIDSLASPIDLGKERTCQVGASLGIAIYPDNATQIDSLYQAADASMYHSKSRGKNVWTLSQLAPSRSVDGVDWMVFRPADCVGVVRIDEQHRGLVGVVNGLNRALLTGRGEPEVKALLDQLVRATSAHFDTEHALMLESDYPDRERHDREHAQLLRELKGMLARLHQGTDLLVLQTVKDWLVGHMQGMDRQLGDYLVRRGFG